jgi:hypothetical protein
MGRSAGFLSSPAAALGLMLWPLLPILAVFPGAWLGDAVSTLAFLMVLGPGPLWCLVGLAVSLGLTRRTPASDAPAWVRRAPWVGVALNGAALLGWAVLMLGGGVC